MGVGIELDWGFDPQPSSTLSIVYLLFLRSAIQDSNPEFPPVQSERDALITSLLSKRSALHGETHQRLRPSLAAIRTRGHCTCSVCVVSSMCTNIFLVCS